MSKPKAQLIITLTEQNEIELIGPTHQHLLCLQMLENARMAVIHDSLQKKQDGIVPVPNPKLSLLQ